MKDFDYENARNIRARAEITVQGVRIGITVTKRVPQGEYATNILRSAAFSIFSSVLCPSVDFTAGQIKISERFVEVCEGTKWVSAEEPLDPSTKYA